MAHLAFCPDDWAKSNLQGLQIVAVNTEGNTLLDALRVALAADKPLSLKLPQSEFGVVSLHRFENIFEAQRFAFIIVMLERMALRIPLVFVLHPATRKQAEMELARYRDSLEVEVARRTADLAAAIEEQQALFDSASVGIVLMKERHIVRCKRRMAEMLG